MKYNRLHINHFGRLQNRTLEFYDGIHVIYGPNESGKSTLHAFLEAMLFGMERGRGRAAKTDNYSRYYPEEGSSTYGGVLEFTQDDTLYAIYRNFKKDPTGFTLMDETHSRQLEPTEEEYRRLLAGLSLPLYRNTVSLRQLQAATSSELPEQLRSHIVNLRSTGSGSLDLGKAREHLKKKRKQLESLCDDTAQGRSQELRANIQAGLEELDGYPVPAELSRLTDEGRTVAEDMHEREQTRRKLLEEIHDREDDLENLPASGGGSRIGGWLFLFLGVLFAVTGLFSLLRPGTLPALPLLIAGLLSLLGGTMLLVHSRRTADWAVKGQEELAEIRRQEEETTEELLGLKSRAQQLSAGIQQLKQSLWQRDALEAQVREWEEALEALQPTLERNRKMQEEIAAVKLARETIDRLAVTAFDSFGNYLQETASRLIRQITGGRYARLMIDDGLHITLEQDHQPVELSALSCSALDQVYLALRIACIDFFWPEESIPLLLDESFAMYDTERIGETLSWLAENYPGQVFLFTCQQREAAILEESGVAHHLIEL